MRKNLDSKTAENFVTVYEDKNAGLRNALKKQTAYERILKKQTTGIIRQVPSQHRIILYSFAFTNIFKGCDVFQVVASRSIVQPEARAII